jgi:hypothetical protein
MGVESLAAVELHWSPPPLFYRLMIVPTHRHPVEDANHANQHLAYAVLHFLAHTPALADSPPSP